jgi:hypothetical protein
LFRVIGTGGTQTSSFTKPHRKKSRGVKSGDRGGQEVDPPLGRAFSKNYPHSWLWYIQLAASPTCWLPWTSLISLPNTINCFRTLTRSAWTLPLTDATCVHSFLCHFLIEFAVWGSFSNFFLNYRWTVITDFVEWNSSTQNAFSGWVAILCLCYTLVARGEITSYACVQ